MDLHRRDEASIRITHDLGPKAEVKERRIRYKSIFTAMIARLGFLSSAQGPRSSILKLPFAAALRLYVLTTLTFLTFPVCAQLSQSDSTTAESNEDPAYESMRVLANAIQLVRQDYVNDKKISYKDLTYSALRGMLSELDPHSQFLDPEAFKGMQEDTRSEFGGLGIQVAIRNGALTIVAPMEGSPSFEAGLMPGDQILKINGTMTDSLTLSQAIDLLRGELGEKVTLTILHPPTNEIKDYTLVRQIIKIPSVRDPHLLPVSETGGRKIGYVRLNQFNEPTAQELSAALDDLEKKGMEALILDLRYNPGGLLNSAIDVCAQFLPANTQVVFTNGRDSNRPFSTPASRSKNRQIPLAILINSSSASGSEIVAGALKDLDRAILVGETTFGKGSVQSVIALNDGSAVRLTTATYLTPSKRPIHEVGISPHIRVALSPQQEWNVLNARRLADSPERTQKQSTLIKDPQLERAVDALQGTLVYKNRNPDKL